MICTCCNQTKPDYHFLSRFGKATSVTRFFFVNPDFSPTQCWACNGDYRCLGCGVIQDASQFRVGGRFCIACKNAGIYQVLPEAYAFRDAVASGSSLTASDELESAENHA
jgi:hypothetical protein